MRSVQLPVARTAVRFLVTHPRARLTRWVVRFVVGRLRRRVSSSPAVERIPPVRGSRLTTIAGVAGVATVTVVLARRSRRPSGAAPAPTPAPFPAPVRTAGFASQPTPTPAEQNDRLAAEVQAKLLEGDPDPGVEVEPSAGVITLRGTLADEEAETRFVRVAEQVAGGKAVQSELRTAQDDPPAS